MSEQEKLYYIGSIIRWDRLSKAKAEIVWIEKEDGVGKGFPSNYYFDIRGSHGFGSFKVCRHFIQYLLRIGDKALNTKIKAVWNAVKYGQPLAEHVYNANRNEPGWRPNIEGWLILHKSMSREHWISRQTGAVYLEMENGEMLTKTRIWHQWMNDTQHESYQHYIVRKGEDIPSLKRPTPSLGHFKRTFGTKLNIKIKRPGKDECNGCTYLGLLKEGAKSEEEQNEIAIAIADHQRRFRFNYAYNTYIRLSCVLSFRSGFGVENLDGLKESRDRLKILQTEQLDRIRNGADGQTIDAAHVVIEDLMRKLVSKIVAFARTKDQCIQFASCHIAADFGVDRPETETADNLCYFRSAIGAKHFPMVVNGVRAVLVWSGMDGGKAVEEQVRCYQWALETHCVGADRVYFCVDGALISFNSLKWMCWQCHPKNPHRHCPMIHCNSLETGHTRIEADNVDQQVTTYYDKKDIWTTLAERVEYVNTHSSVEMVQFKDFYFLPAFYDQIFKAGGSWTDTLGNKVLIRDDKPITFEFGISEHWNQETQSFSLVEHYDEMWLKISEDPTVPHRRVSLFRKGFAKKSAADFEDVPLRPKSRPKIKKKIMKHVMDVVTLCPNKEELIEYYGAADIVDESDYSGDEQDDSKSAVSTPTRSLTKMKRRRELAAAHREGTFAVLTPYERNRNQIECVGVSQNYSIGQLSDVIGGGKRARRITVAQLKVECQRHHIPCNLTKVPLATTLRAHYQNGCKPQGVVPTLPTELALPMFDTFSTLSLPSLNYDDDNNHNRQ